ncbi:MAG: hypothetical protein KGI51_15540 [Rhodospirillales bacterium]|nr:hypothetical protein [Rhodospirillales bacterium]
MDGLIEIPARAARRRAAAGVLFAEDFDSPAAAARPPLARPIFTAAELDAARAAGFAEGRDIALAEAAAQHDAALDEAARALAARLAQLREDARHGAEQAATALARLLLDTLAALFPTLCARHGPAEAEAVLAALLPGLHGESELVLRANPRDIPPLRAALAAAAPALAERAEWIASEIAVPGDVALAWRHGSAARDIGAIWRDLAAALAPAGLTLPPIPEPTDAR